MIRFAPQCSTGLTAGIADCEGSAEAITEGDWPLSQARQAHWWVLHTRARHEKRVAEALDQHGVDYFMPLVPSKRTYGKRVVEFSVPLFPGYVFLSGDHDDVEVAWQTNRVANIIPVSDQARLTRELRQIHALITSGKPVDLYPGLRKGRRCRIVTGPLKGLEGVVTRRRNVSRFFVAVSFVGQSAVVEIDGARLEAAE